MRAFFDYEFPLTKLYIEADGEFITKISFFEIFGNKKETPVIKRAKKQLDEYFSGKRTTFDLPLKLEGTEFQKSVWKELMKIPYGKTASYYDIASAVQNPKACRAVGMANNKNKIPIIIPCHRIIGKSGALTGYAGGLEVKKKLLELEAGQSAKA